MCDCPTEKFPGECQSFPGETKKPLNLENKYNQNFLGKFCNCQKLIYNEEEDMMQCPICSDYFHPECQGIPLELVAQP